MIHDYNYASISDNHLVLFKLMKQIIYNIDKAYQLVRVLKEDQIKNPDTSLLKKWFYCDTLLRNQGKLYFCRLIEEIEYEEINI